MSKESRQSRGRFLSDCLVCLDQFSSAAKAGGRAHRKMPSKVAQTSFEAGLVSYLPHFFSDSHDLVHPQLEDFVWRHIRRGLSLDEMIVPAVATRQVGYSHGGPGLREIILFNERAELSVSRNNALLDRLCIGACQARLLVYAETIRHLSDWLVETALARVLNDHRF